MFYSNNLGPFSIFFPHRFKVFLRSHVTEGVLCVGAGNAVVRLDSCFLKALIRGTLMLNIANWK